MSNVGWFLAWGGLSIVAAFAACSVGCGSPADPPDTFSRATSNAPGTKMTVTSTAVENGQPVPKRHTGDGGDVSPPLAWSGVPEGTKELALLAEDPDAPQPQPWVHWVIYKIPADTAGLKEGIPRTEQVAEPAGAVQGNSSYGTVGYRGPAPPKGHGVHHYHFRLYALDVELDAKPGLDKAGLLRAIAGHVLAEAGLVGTYKR
jgi:Raf kinase inhibitor-like YbhB/YbcL family protein